MIDLYTGFDRPQTLLAGLLGGAFLSMASHGADQVIVQRLLASASLRDAQKALIGSGIMVFVQFTLFLLIGTGLWVSMGGRHVDSPDTIFPQFIISAMPPGLVGLLIAAILAATMSAHSGAINSLAASTLHDIYLPMTGRQANDPRSLRGAKGLTLFWGVVLLAAALLYRQQGTPVVVVALSIASFTYGALLGGFFLGIVWRRAIQRDALTGMAVGIIVMTLVVFAKPLSAVLVNVPLLVPLSSVAWPWYVLIGTTVTVGAGMLSSLTHSRIS